MIDQNISDLFFNTDHTGAVLYDKCGNFEGYDTNILHDDAEMFLNCLRQLNISVPDESQLIADFMNRL